MIPFISCFFFFNDTATTEIYTLSLHDALPISRDHVLDVVRVPRTIDVRVVPLRRLVLHVRHRNRDPRSEEHTSELQSQSNLVCRLLLEKKKHMGYIAFTDERGNPSNREISTPV